MALTGAMRFRRWLPRVASLLLSLAILTALYAGVDTRAMLAAIRAADPAGLTLSIGLIVPLTLLRAFRFLRAAPRGTVTGFDEATRLTLSAAALNLVFPAKSGDLLKSWVLSGRGADASLAVSLVLYERLADLFGLFAWSVLAGVVAPPVPGVAGALSLPLLAGGALVLGVLLSSERLARWLLDVITGRGRLKRLERIGSGWPALHRQLGSRRIELLAISLAMWLLSLTQVWLFTVALSLNIPYVVSLSVTALALLAGQVPGFFAGLGPRDVAFVALLAGHAPPEGAAALGLLASTRVLLPALAGLPLVPRYASGILAHLGRPAGDRATSR